MDEVTVQRNAEVGTQTIAVELESPPDFDADPGQFVLVRETIDDEEESGHYTIPSKDVEGTFEITVGYDINGTVEPWFAKREPRDEIHA